MKMLWNKTEKNSSDLAAHAQRDAETYVMKVDHAEMQRRIEDKLDRLFDILQKKADRQ